MKWFSHGPRNARVWIEVTDFLAWIITGSHDCNPFMAFQSGKVVSSYSSHDFCNDLTIVECVRWTISWINSFTTMIRAIVSGRRQWVNMNKCAFVGHIALHSSDWIDDAAFKVWTSVIILRPELDFMFSLAVHTQTANRVKKRMRFSIALFFSVPLPLFVSYCLFVHALPSLGTTHYATLSGRWIVRLVLLELLHYDVLIIFVAHVKQCFSTFDSVLRTRG